MDRSNPEASIVPFGSYKAWVRHGDLIYISGLTPRVGTEMLFPGRVGRDVTVEDARQAAIVIANRVLACMREAAGDLDSISSILMLNVYVSSASNFLDHSKIADFVSAELFEALGERAMGARTAIGVESLPGNAPIEVMTIAAMRDSSVA